MSKLFFWVLLIYSTFSFSQKVIFGENFEDINQSGDRYKPYISIGGTLKKCPIVDFSYTSRVRGDGDDSCLKVDVLRSTGNGYSASLNFMNINLSKNKTYKLTYSIKSKVTDDNFRITIFSSFKTGSKYPKFSPLLDQSINFTGNDEWQRKEITFQAIPKKNKKIIDIENMGIGFCFDIREGTFYLDNVKLVEL